MPQHRGHDAGEVTGTPTSSKGRLETVGEVSSGLDLWHQLSEGVGNVCKLGAMRLTASTLGEVAEERGTFLSVYDTQG